LAFGFLGGLLGLHMRYFKGSQFRDES
jgi:hypothetical protein